MKSAHAFAAVTAGMLLGSAGAAAENALFTIPFGSEPGQPLAHAYDYGAPPLTEGRYTMRVPSVDPVMMAHLHDVELTIEAAGRIVQRAYAARAYRALGDCAKAREEIAEKITRVLPAPYTGSDSHYQSQSADGRVIGGIVCEQARHLPFPVLIMKISLAP
jgi:hypothetical protein